MASIGHLAVGMAAGRRFANRSRYARAVWPAMIALSLPSFLPDFDVIAFALGIPYAAPWGHRGAAHSFAFALAIGVLAFLLFRLRGRGDALRVGLFSGGVFASHLLLDTLTSGGLGVALLWPFSDQRFLAGWQPMTAVPIGLRLVSHAGLRLLLIEAVLFVPLFVYALWPRRRAADRHASCESGIAVRRSDAPR